MLHFRVVAEKAHASSVVPPSFVGVECSKRRRQPPKSNIGLPHPQGAVSWTSHNFEKQGACDNGRHEISSSGAFGITVWGWGSKDTGGSYGFPGGGFYTQAVSYAYPAGASVQPINGVTVPPVPR